MKILSIQNLKIAAVVLGLLAITLAFRPGKAKQNATRPVDFKPIRIQSTFDSEVPQISTSPLPPHIGDAGPMLLTGSYPNSNHGGFALANQVGPPSDAELTTIVAQPDLAKPVLTPADGFELVLDNSDPSSIAEADIAFEFDVEETATAQQAEFVKPVTEAPPVEFVQPLDEAKPQITFVAPLNDATAQQAESAKPIAEAQPVEFVQPLDEANAQVMVVAPLNDAAAQQAVHHIEYGKSLARRNATQAAGQEFFGALRVLAEANDTAVGGNQHTMALRNGLLAVREATDFKTDDPQRQLVIDVASVIEGHESRILGAEEARNVTASNAMRRYFDYAGQQLGKCGGQNAVAAEALYCLGKMRSLTSQGNPDPESLDTYEAIIFHHASLAADSSNFRSANELGVLLAKNGHLSAAEAYLKNSLQVHAIPQAWANLAKVHLRKGSAQDQQLANLAAQEYQVALAQPPQNATQGLIQWVEPGEFIARSPAVMHGSSQGVAATVPTVVPASTVQPESGSPSFVQRIGSLFVPKNTKQ